MTTEEALKKSNSNYGKFVVTREDLSPYAIAYMLLKSIAVHSAIVSVCKSKGDLELF